MKLTMVGINAILTIALAAVGASAQQAPSCPAGTSGSIDIAGSSTVLPVAEAWRDLFQQKCPGWTVNVEGGGSSAGARQVCNQDLKTGEGAVEVGDMSREWKSAEATTSNNWLYKCAQTDREAIQVLVGYDGLSITVARNSAADACINSLPNSGLTIDQLRWMYSSYSINQLVATGWQQSSVPNLGTDPSRRLWSELGGSACPDTDILISGADIDSGTQSYFREVVFADEDGGETFANRVGGYENSAVDEDIVAYLLANEAAIGYFGFAYVVQNLNTLHAVKIENDAGVFIEPSAESIFAKTYNPFSRPIYMNVLNQTPVREKVGHFLEFGFSEDGDDAVRQVGYVPTTLAEKVVMRTRAQSQFGIKQNEVTCGGSSGSFKIAGSSTVFPVAELWVGVYTVWCNQIDISLEGGGSSVGARRVCDQSNEPGESAVDIGDMSRNWKDSEATTTNGWERECTGSNREVFQIEVAIDGLSVVTKNEGTAFECIEALGGLTIDQLRWIYSDLPKADLIADGWDASSVPGEDGNDNTHKWSELSSDSRCRDVEIMIAGADVLSGTYDYMAEVIFNDDLGETFDRTRPNAEPYFNSALDEEVVAYLIENENAIGYFGYSYVAQNLGQLLPVPIRNGAGKFVKPEPATIESGEYEPLARRIYMNLLDTPSALALTVPFIEFGLSDAGQALVQTTGYSAIPSWEVFVMRTRAETESGVPIAAVTAAHGELPCASKPFSIAGSSTVFPIAQIWAGIYEVGCDVEISVEGGGSSVGAGRVCANSEFGDAVDVGDMSREWKDKEASQRESSKIYDCVAGDTSRSVVQARVATDGLTVAVLKGGIADECLQKLGGLTVDQLRWIYTDLTDQQLLDDANWDSSAVPFPDNLGTTHLWRELNSECSDAEILISGADPLSGTYDYFKEVVFVAEGESFDLDRSVPYVNSAVDEDLVQYLTENPAAISYFGYSYYARNLETLSAAAIKNDEGTFIIPNESTVASNEYNPFSRPIYMNFLNTKENLENTLPFLAFGYNTEGTKLVEFTGYVPVTDKVSQDTISTIESLVGQGGGGDGGDDDLSGGAIAGIVIGCLVGLVLVGFIAMKVFGGRSQKEKDGQSEIDDARKTPSVTEVA